MQLTQDEIFEALGLAMEKIEAAGASPELTAAGAIVGDIRAAVGNKWNPSRPESAQQVRAKLKPSADVQKARAALKPVIEYVQAIKNHVPIGIVAAALQARDALDAHNAEIGHDLKRRT